MSSLDHLTQRKGQFGREASRHIVNLLKEIRQTKLREADALIRLHETLLYLRAYPASPRVAQVADQALFSFGERLTGLDPELFGDAEVSGIAGTEVATAFSYEFARHLVLRHGRAVYIDWENYDQQDRLGRVLSSLLPMCREDYSVESHVDWRRWFEAARCDLRWLIDNLDARTYDLLELPLRWELGDSAASRSNMRLPGKALFFHKGPLLKRSEVSIEAEFKAPRIPVRRLAPAKAKLIASLIADTSAVRYRELYGFGFPDLKHVYHADLGRGVDFYFFGVPPENRLPLRTYHTGMFFKNGVPAGYFEGLSLFERMEAGFNLYYTFREGETAWLYARLLKIFRQHLGVTCFSIDPYQIGHENEEAIASGAFWFYRKLGFQPASEQVARLVAGEEEKISKVPGYRTSPAILRRLAAGLLVYGGGKEWGCFSMRRLGQRVGKRIDPISAIPELRRAKQAPEETRYLRLLQRLPRLRQQILALGSE